MMHALRKVAGDVVSNRVQWQRDAQIEKIVASWPESFEASFGKALGMQADEDFASIIRAHVEDEALC